MSVPYAEVIGDPVAHSKSPAIHKFWLDALQMAGDYRATSVAPDALAAFIARRRDDPDWRGCNVTIPHKIAVMQHVTDPGYIRSSIGAMNTVLRGRDGVLTGTNTDAAGFAAPIADAALDGAHAAVVGTGGAAHAVMFALARLGVADVTLITRNPLKGAALLARFGLKGRVQTIGTAVPPVALLVNASSLGMSGQAPLPLDLTPLPNRAIVYDIVYTPLKTPLLLAAEARGLAVVDGLEMLIGQAAVAFELFYGAAPPRDRDAALRTVLTS